MSSAPLVITPAAEPPSTANPTPIETPRYTAGHLGGLRRFALAITVLNIIGHFYLGFEQSYAQPLVAVTTAYTLQLLLEFLNARAEGRTPRYLGGVGTLVDFLLSAHIAAMSISMLLYFNENLTVIAFAVAMAITSKTLFRVPVGSEWRHFLNPSNFGISVTLLLFPWVGLAMPWHYSAGPTGIGDWIFVGIVLMLGSMINICFTRRFFVVLGFLAGFVGQILVRVLFFDASLLGCLMPATGVAAWIFTFYMATDPSTTPSKPGAQFLFGFSIGVVYLILMLLHVVFGLFFALTIVCIFRGAWLTLQTVLHATPEPSPAASA